MAARPGVRLLAGGAIFNGVAKDKRAGGLWSLARGIGMTARGNCAVMVFELADQLVELGWR